MVDGQSVAATTNKKVLYMLQLEPTPLQLPMLHSGSSTALIALHPLRLPTVGVKIKFMSRFRATVVLRYEMSHSIFT